MHLISQVLTDHVNSGAKPDGLRAVTVHQTAAEAHRQAGSSHARVNRTSKKQKRISRIPDSTSLGIEATAVWLVRKRHKSREHDFLLRMDRSYEQWVMSSFVIAF